MEGKPGNFQVMFKPIVNQYWLSWGIRGDNTPEAARFLGYLDFKELYPDVEGERMQTVFERILKGGRKLSVA